MITIHLYKVEGDEEELLDYYVSDDGGDYDPSEAYAELVDAEQDADERLDHYGGHKYARILVEV